MSPASSVIPLELLNRMQEGGVLTVHLDVAPAQRQQIYTPSRQTLTSTLMTMFREDRTLSFRHQRDELVQKVTAEFGPASRVQIACAVNTLKSRAKRRDTDLFEPIKRRVTRN